MEVRAGESGREAAGSMGGAGGGARGEGKAEQLPRREKVSKAAGLALVGIAVTSAGHYLTPASYLLWHGVFQRLYYLPVVYAAITLGWRGGLAAALASGVGYAPHIALHWRHLPHYTMEQYAEILMFFLVGGVTGVLADRERRRRTQLQETARQLERVYRELQDSVEQVKRADRLAAIGQLAAGLAHEIRNPLASIDGAAEVLEQETENGELRREIVGIVRKECARLNRLLGNLLDFARPRSPQWGEVDLREVFQGVLELVKHAANKNVRFRQEVEEELPRVRGDREQLAQVVLNLTLNAAQAMPEGGEVVLRAQARGEEVVVEVSDEGPGIAEELRERIFDPFFTTKPQGTGLGLAVANQIVAQHGGRLSLTTNGAKGATFTVTLPRAGGPAK